MTTSKGRHAPRGLSNSERFDWRSGARSDGCIIWKGAVTKWGHGHFTLKQEDGSHKTVIAHRYAYIRAYGHPSGGKIICHRCDVPACVNPEHLYEGTPKSNCHDARRAGTHISVRPELQEGAANGRAILSKEDVLMIRGMQDLHSRAEIAVTFGVSASTVSNISLGRTWRHV